MIETETSIPAAAPAAEFMSAAQVVKACPRPDGSEIHPSTLSRWSREGLNGVRLKVTRVGGRRYYRPSDLERFLAATAAAVGGVTSND